MPGCHIILQANHCTHIVKKHSFASAVRLLVMIAATSAAQLMKTCGKVYNPNLRPSTYWTSNVKTSLLPFLVA